MHLDGVALDLRAEVVERFLDLLLGDHRRGALGQQEIIDKLLGNGNLDTDT